MIGSADLVIDFGIEDPAQDEDIPFPYSAIPAQMPSFYDECTLLLDQVVPVMGGSLTTR